MQEHEPPAGQAASPTIFWGELAPSEHLVQVYQDEGGFLENLAGFVGAGLGASEAVIVIATAAHRSSLDARLTASGHDMRTAREEGRYLAFDAADTLSRFMQDGWPDEQKFAATITDVLAQAAQGRRVRAFGEMVALLWARGENGATVRLEHLWDEFCRDHALALFCAYPRIGATRDLDASLAEVCALHSRIVT
jgi:hypothetical protein